MEVPSKVRVSIKHQDKKSKRQAGKTTYKAVKQKSLDKLKNGQKKSKRGSVNRSQEVDLDKLKRKTMESTSNKLQDSADSLMNTQFINSPHPELRLGNSGEQQFILVQTDSQGLINFA